MGIFRNSFFREWAREGPHQLFASDAAKAVISMDWANPFEADQPLTEGHVYQAVEDLLGYQKLVGVSGVAGAHITRTTPAGLEGVLTDGLQLGDAYLYCTGIIASEMLGARRPDDVTGMAVADRWRTKTQWENVPFKALEDRQVLATAGPLFTAGGGPYPDEGDALRRGWLTTSRYVSKRVKPGGRFTTIRANTGLNFASDGNSVGEPVPLKQCFASVTYTHHLVPLAAVPWGAIAATFGCVNSESPFDGYSVGTLLFDDMDLEIYRGPLGDWLASIIYFLKWLPNVALSGTQKGHNAILRLPVGGGAPDYDYMTSGGVGTFNYVYPLKPLAALFRPDQS